LAINPDLPRCAAADNSYIAETGNPTRGVKAVDAMFMLAIGWYETQIAV